MRCMWCRSIRICSDWCWRSSGCCCYCATTKTSSSSDADGPARPPVWEPLMPRSLPQKIADAARLLLLSAEDRAYLRLIRESGAFDRAYYLEANPKLHRLFRLFPERHYLREGEAMGLCPNPTFSPYAYLAQNDDLAAKGIRPFRHWIERGQAEGRKTLADLRPAPVPALPRLDAPVPPERAAPVAVALHLYYPDLWPEFHERLAAQSFDFDLFVTLTGPAALADGPAEAIRAAWPAAGVWTLPNRGRDILPFAHLAQSGLLRPYAAVCKLHGKRSPHRRDGDAWRTALADGVLGPPGPTAARLRTFLDRADAGLWMADGQLYRGNDWWGMNRKIAKGVLSRIGIDPAASLLRFPAGSVYWVKPAILDRLCALELTTADFEPEVGLVDGTMAHALERSVGLLVADAGLEMIETRNLDTPLAGGHSGTDRR
ncbi:hypothetical protein DXV76_14865 [Rhodobacteraceae bacterium CCMM004]|nr:hypothetical protein DXV76_14865 [Rhodobacteraceae bacterium CCMM004]